MRVLFFGILGSLTRRPLAALLAAGVKLCGLVLPAEIVPPFELVDNGRSPHAITSIQTHPPGLNLLPTGQVHSPLALAAAHDVPAFAVRRLAAPETVTALAALEPDLIGVSCFPHRLPPAILNLPRLGCLNMHPSLLPRFRGPAPLFWTLRAGVAETGVTIHYMDENFDTGDVALQRPFALPDGISHAELETKLAQLGGHLLVTALQKLEAGTLPRLPQPPGSGSDPWPRAADFELNTNWSARRAFNFLRGTGNWERPYAIQVAGQTVWLAAAVSFNPEATLPQPILAEDSLRHIQFTPGVLTARLGQRPSEPAAA
ncbi:MAG: methionyl-tRNA formyltransferase [Anaerolineaceae bacterium]|nr:methionyl-tRNA formyltransferase [Anaerolineaceae bacterium]